MIVLNILLRIHRKLKEVAVFRYIKKVDKDDGSVSILFSLVYRSLPKMSNRFTISVHNAVNILNPGEE